MTLGMSSIPPYGFPTTLYRIAALIPLLCAVPACSNDPASPPPPAIASVTISPRPTSLVIGQSVQLLAVARTSSGEDVPGAAIVWTVTGAAIGTISTNGLLSVTGAGVVQVLATVGSISDSLGILVRSIEPDTIVVTPQGDTLPSGSQVTLGATVLTATGDTISSPSLSFTTLDPSVATVNSTGTVTAVGTGVATIVVQSGPATTTVHILVPDCAPSASIQVNSFTLPVRAGGTVPAGGLVASGLYKGTGVLYGAGLILGVGAGATAVGYDPADLSSDFANSPVCQLAGPTASHTYSRLSLASGAPGPTGLRIVQETFADTPAGTTEFVLFRYTILNTRSTPISTLRIGFAADWDLDYDFTSTDDLATVSIGSPTVEIQEPDSNAHPQLFGITSIGSGAPAAAIWLNGTSVTNADFYNRLGDTPPSAQITRGELRALVGRGTLSLAPGEQVATYFALIGGDTRTAFMSNLMSAQQAAEGLGFPSVASGAH